MQMQQIQPEWMHMFQIFAIKIDRVTAMHDADIFSIEQCIKWLRGDLDVYHPRWWYLTFTKKRTSTEFILKIVDDIFVNTFPLKWGIEEPRRML